MTVYESPAYYRRKPGDHRLAVFVAGGITACPDWQAQAIALLDSDDVVILNPRRAVYPRRDPDAVAVQVTWEYKHLHLPGVVTMFWFPACVATETVQPISLLELGACLGEGRPAVVGASPEYPRRQDVLLQCELARPWLVVRDTLADTVAAVRRRMVAS